MNILHLRNLQHHLKQAVAADGGSILVYVIVVMTIFGLLGAAMVAMFSSATMMSTGTPNYARQARYLAESGMRYAVGQLRTDGYRPSVIDRLNDTAYSISGVGGFDLNVFGKWFEAAADYSQPSGTIALTIPDGAWVEGFAVPAGAYLVNLESYRDSIYFGGGAATANASAQIRTAPDLSTSPFTVTLLDDFQADASQGHRILVALKPDAAAYTFPVALSAGDTLQVAGTAAGFFPEANGSFYVVSTAPATRGRIYQLYYQSVDAQGDLAGISDPVSLAGSDDSIILTEDDYIILTERNHTIAATATAGGSGSGGRQTLSMDFRQNIAHPPPPSPMSLPPDISPSDFASGDTATPASTTDAVWIGTDAVTGKPTVKLGGGEDTAGAAWYGGSVTLGGFDVCTGGECAFNDGIRAFFVVDYAGTGNGFTFALASGSANNVDAFGGTGGNLGYAGTSPTGKQIAKPKLAVEFDTYTNAGQNDPDDDAWTNRDMIQYVYWGIDAASNGDDNTHDDATGGRQQQLLFTARDAIYTTPAVDPDDGTVYVGSLDNYLRAIRPDGTIKWQVNMGDDIESSPVIDSDGNVYVGSNYGIPEPGGRMNAVSAAGYYRWVFPTGSDVKSSPVIDSSGILYFGTGDEDLYFYALDTSRFARYKWRYTDVAGAISANSAVALSPDESTVYFTARDPAGSTNADGYDNHFLYALNTANGALRWTYNLAGPVYSAPRVADDGTVYVGSDGGSRIGYLFAIDPDSTQKWRYDFPLTNPHSRPAIGPDGTIYIGNNDSYLYAITDNGATASTKWTFLTGGNVASSPLVHGDGSIWFGSDDNHVYALDSEGNKLAQYNVGADVRAGLSQGADGTVYVPTVDGDVYAFSPTCAPQNMKTRHYSSADLPGGIAVASADDWLQSGPWAVRVEIARSRSLNARNRYAYGLKMWIRQCQEAGCNDVLDTYFQDTRIEYAARAPHLAQTVEMCAADHGSFDTFIFGFTEGTGSEVQRVDITETQLGFIRPGDASITVDADWP